jgi:site-specific recombinase XerD
MDRYFAAKEGQIAENYCKNQRTHLKHLSAFLGKIADQPCNLVTRTTLEEFLRERKKTRDGETVNREQCTLKSFYDWVVLQEDVPSFPFPAEKLPRFKGSRDRDAFKTTEEIEEILARGGLENAQMLDQWESLYLDPTRIADLLALVRKQAVDPTSFLLHAIPAFTGMRRGEVLRLCSLALQARQ